ncbi:MAG: RusA family crossover junction endodeoxyribonuclease [Ahrensia sp.]|nr:RusA family crossover junction endodeoxyribonuclease [Ahrensia sp.]
MIEITIKGRAVPKGRPRFVRGMNRPFTPEKTVKAERAVAKLAQEAMDRAPYFGIPMAGPVRLEVLAVFEIPKSWNKAKRAAAIEGNVWHTSTPDSDNLIKLISDGMNKIVFNDDGQVADCRCAKRYGSPARTIVRVTPLKNWNDYCTL